MEVKTEDKTQEVVQKLTELGNGILTYIKEYGKYQLRHHSLAKTMTIDAETGSFGVIGDVLTNYIQCEPDAFMDDIENEWKSLEQAIERNIRNGVEPKVETQVLEACGL